MELKTPLYDIHIKYGGKPVPFAGYLLPIQYSTGITAEHMATRTAAGLFDVSHMGEILIEGENALKNIQNLVCNDCSGMYDGQIKYSPMLNERGGVVDDLLIYKYNDSKYLLVVNASNKDKDVEWVKNHIFGSAEYKDISNEIAQLAIQGPRAAEIVSKLCNAEDLPQKYYSFKDNVPIAGINCMVSKTGYTGEDGFEIYTKSEYAVDLWEKLMSAGSDSGLIPCALGARDTLRLEASMPLYGHEMTDDISPLETGLGFFVKMQKDDFIGKKALEEKGEPKLKRIGLEVTDRGIAREHCKVFQNGKEIGMTTSGTMCPFIKKAVAMALVDTSFGNEDDEIKIEVRGKLLSAKAVRLPFYKKTK